MGAAAALASVPVQALAQRRHGGPQLPRLLGQSCARHARGLGARGLSRLGGTSAHHDHPFFPWSKD
eukprot:1617453-Pyramimonas_sp.AAC.1